LLRVCALPSASLNFASLLIGAFLMKNHKDRQLDEMVTGVEDFKSKGMTKDQYGKFLAAANAAKSISTRKLVKTMRT